MGYIYHDLCSFDNAILALESAVTIKKQVYREYCNEVANQLLELAFLYCKQESFTSVLVVAITRRSKVHSCCTCFSLHGYHQVQNGLAQKCSTHPSQSISGYSQLKQQQACWLRCLWKVATADISRPPPHPAEHDQSIEYCEQAAKAALCSPDLFEHSFTRNALEMVRTL